jgi:hypothetical protein
MIATEDSFHESLGPLAYDSESARRPLGPPQGYTFLNSRLRLLGPQYFWAGSDIPDASRRVGGGAPL